MEERDRKRWKGKKDEIKMKRDNGIKREKENENTGDNRRNRVSLTLCSLVETPTL